MNSQPHGPDDSGFIVRMNQYVNISFFFGLASSTSFGNSSSFLYWMQLTHFDAGTIVSTDCLNFFRDSLSRVIFFDKDSRNIFMNLNLSKSAETHQGLI